MADYLVKFDLAPRPVAVPPGALLTDAARMAGVEIGQPCGGQGRCGRCIVQVVSGKVRRRSMLRLSPTDLAAGYALACQTVVESDLEVVVPPQDRLERRLTTDRVVGAVKTPPGYSYQLSQTLKRVALQLSPPSLEDQTDDYSRLKTALKKKGNFPGITASLGVLKKLGSVLREGDWEVTVIVDVQEIADEGGSITRLVDVLPGQKAFDDPLWGAAIDIGTTTVSLWLVDLITGDVKAQVSEYNRQIGRGEDVISRIVYASKPGGEDELRSLVLTTINELVLAACQQAKPFKASPESIYKAAIAGNSTMLHLLTGIPPASIRLSPFITAINSFPLFRAEELVIQINPQATVDCLYGVASYVGSDITAGVLSSGTDDTSKITLFMDVGTNGEIVLGSREWLVTCACSAGPAFEGAGVACGMRATRGAIEEVWINSETYEPTYRVIGGGKPKGICGSGLISLLAELFMTGVVDKAGNYNTSLPTRRVRSGENGLEYVVAYSEETETGKDIVLTHIDIDNLLRAKAAIYAGYTILAESVGVPMDLIEQMLIGGSFGKYINIEKAVQIGLLPDLPWDRFQFLGNTAVLGAYYALLDKEARRRIEDIAGRMTYIELSSDNSFYEAFMSALFLPHTDMTLFPSIAAVKDKSMA